MFVCTYSISFVNSYDACSCVIYTYILLLTDSIPFFSIAKDSTLDSSTVTALVRRIVSGSLVDVLVVFPFTLHVVHLLFNGSAIAILK